MPAISAHHLLTPQGWKQDHTVSFDDAGLITAVKPNNGNADHRTGILLPSPANLHSHAFQRAMAGLTETRGPDPQDSFWTWRKLMYAFLDHLTPEDIESISAFVQMEMLEAGYASVGEFHYIHHQPGGTPYNNLAELSDRVMAAANLSGIGLTHLPVLYEHGGCDGRELGPGQIRFGNHLERFEKLHALASRSIEALPGDCLIGVAPHSLRAVSRESLKAAIQYSGTTPFHMHIAEQVAEVDEVQAAWGARPVEWLLANHEVGDSWCLIHCTQMTSNETATLATTGAVAGLCPITESSLGDGIFDGVDFISSGGRFGIGSDSNIRISLSEELRTLEYSQRLRDQGRAMLATPEKSTGRVMFDGITAGGAQAIGRKSGAIEPGMLADFVALDACHVDLEGKSGDQLLDSFIFAGDDRMITDVWSAGRHLVKEGIHPKRETIIKSYQNTMKQLRERL